MCIRDRETMKILIPGFYILCSIGMGYFCTHFQIDKDTVSYTHLDVYKRQGNTLFEKINKALKKIGNCIHNIRKDTKYKDCLLYTSIC